MDGNVGLGSMKNEALLLEMVDDGFPPNAVTFDPLVRALLEK